MVTNPRRRRHSESSSGMSRDLRRDETGTRVLFPARGPGDLCSCTGKESPGRGLFDPGDNTPRGDLYHPLTTAGTGFRPTPSPPRPSGVNQLSSLRTPGREEGRR